MKPEHKPSSTLIQLVKYCGVKEDEDSDFVGARKVASTRSTVQNPGWLMMMGDYATRYTQMLKLEQLVTALALCDSRCISRTRMCQRMPSM